jgi:Fe2+ transport system protein FeoA
MNQKSESRNEVSLLDLKSGEKGIVASIHAGLRATQRLSDMGLIPGTEVTVLKSAPFGPIEIFVKGSKLAIGRGLAAKVFVIPCKKEK